jgi:hypothetical protein
MRRLLGIAVLSLMAAAAFAQDAPKNNEIYGAVWLDYDASGARLGNAGLPMTASNFSFSRVRFGLRNTLADNVKTWFEFDPRNLEFRQVNVDWSPVAGFDLIAGKQGKLFAQNNDWLFSDRTLGLQARYAVPGLGWAGIQVGNAADITNVSSKKLGWESTSPTPITIAEQNPGFVMVYPQVTVKPDLGKDIALEVGVNAEITADKLTISSPTGTAINGYLIVSGYGASLTAEYTLTNVNDTTTANQDMVLYTKLAYNAGVVSPTAYFVVDNLAGTNTQAIGSFKNNSTPNATVMVELPVNATKDLVIDPFFSYGVSGYNLMEYFAQGWTASTFPVNDWTLGLRIKYAISSKW